MKNNITLISGLLFLSIVLTLFLSSTYLPAQKIIDDKAEFIKTQVLKNEALRDFYGISKYMEKKNIDYLPYSNAEDKYEYYQPSMESCYGYQPIDFDCEVTKSSLKYIDTTWTIYEVRFPYTINNRALLYWNKENLSLITYEYLIGINAENKLKYIYSPSGIKSDIKKDFNLDINEPESYIPYLSFRYHPKREIEYLYTEDSLWVFRLLKREKDNLIWEKEFLFNPYASKGERERIKNRALKIYSKGKNSFVRRSIDTLINLEDFEIKKQYLQDALMGNIYMHKVAQNRHIVDEMLDTTYGDYYTYKTDYSDIGIIPDYDEQLELELVWQCSYSRDNVDLYKKTTNKLSFPKIGSHKGYKDVWVGTSLKFHDHLELYGFYKAKDYDLLCKQAGDEEVCRYDMTFRDQPIKGIPRRLDDTNAPAQVCIPLPLKLHEYHKQGLDYYLVALNTKTRKIYFVSGEDIYLSKIGHLYDLPKIGLEINTPRREELQLSARLLYLDHRLYCYRIPIIQKEDIQIYDNEKLVIKTDGFLGLDSISVSATMYYENPDDLEIEIVKK